MKLVKATEQAKQYCYKLSTNNMAPYYERWGEPVLDEAQWMDITSAYDIHLIVTGGGQTIGFVSVQADPNDPSAMFTAEIQIEEGHRGEGTFKEIRFYIRGLMLDMGLAAMTGSIHRDNPLVSFYEKIGYRKVGITSTRYSIKKEFSPEEIEETKSKVLQSTKDSQ